MQYVLVFGRNGGMFTTQLLVLHCNNVILNITSFNVICFCKQTSVIVKKIVAAEKKYKSW